MSLNRLSQCDPWANFARLQQELNQAFGLASLSSSGPTLKVFEDGSALVLEAVVPGYTLEEIEITVHDANQLTIKGEHKEVKTEAKETWHRKERDLGKFSRTLQFAFPIDSEKVQAKLENGILKLVLPKHESVVGRKIPIHTQN